MSRGLQTLLTARHSLTAHNAEQRITGRIDEPLSDVGRRLAREALVDLGGPVSAEVVVASPMSRSIETATILTGRDPSEIEIDELCLERDYGGLQGLDSEQVKAFADRVDYVEVGGIRHSLNPPDGEPFELVRERAERFRFSLQTRPARSFLLVSHQVFLQQLHGSLLGLDVHECLGLDVATLQVDRFEIETDAGQLVHHELVFAGMRLFPSW